MVGQRAIKEELKMENAGFVLNLNDVDASKVSKFEVLPKGDYEAIIDDCEFGYSKNSGAPMLTWKFKLTDPEFNNRTFFFYTTLNKDFGIAMLKKVLMVSGAQVDMSCLNPQELAESGETIGLPIKVKLGIQTYEGEKRNNVKDVDVSSEGAEGSFF